MSKLLTRAEEVGIVKIKICSPYGESRALERTLQEKYHLQHLTIVQHAADGEDPLAEAAAAYFLSQLRPEDTIGVGWGTSVSRLISRVDSASFPAVQVVPLAGSFGNTISHFPNFGALRLSEALGAAARVLHTPALCASNKEYRTLMANSATRTVLHQAEHADILLLGIGAFADSISPQYGIFSEAEIAALRAGGAIGDVALQYFDRSGRAIHTDMTGRMIKADIFKASTNARTSIGIAEGARKARMIDIALKQKLVNALFTNEETALALLGL